MAKTNKEICAELRKNGAKSVTSSINRASAQVLADWTRVRIELDAKVPAYIRQDDDSYQLGEDNVLFISLYGLLNGLRDTEYDVLIDHLKNNPKAVNILFKDAKAVFIPQMVKEGDVDADGNAADHDAIYWHCESVSFSGVGEQWAQKTVLGVLGIL